MRHRSIRPISAKASLTTSWAPTDTPPLATITSAQASAARSAVHDVSRSSRRDAEREHLGARLARLGGEARPVAVGDLRRRRAASPTGTQLVARRQDSDARPPVSREARVAAGRGDGDVAAGESSVPAASIGSPARRSLPARRMCAPTAPRPRRSRRSPGGRRRPAAHRSPRPARPRPRRRAAARRSGCARRAGRRPGLAVGRPAADSPITRSCTGRSRRRGDVRRTDREAIHRAVVPGRQRQPARQIASARTRPSRVLERDLLGGERLERQRASARAPPRALSSGRATISSTVAVDRALQPRRARAAPRNQTGRRQSRTGRPARPP